MSAPVGSKNAALHWRRTVTYGRLDGSSNRLGSNICHHRIHRLYSSLIRGLAKQSVSARGFVKGVTTEENVFDT